MASIQRERIDHPSVADGIADICEVANVSGRIRPEHDEIAGFARRLAERTGYRVLDESPESKVFLLGRRSEGRYLPGRAPELEPLPMVSASA